MEERKKERKRNERNGTILITKLQLLKTKNNVKMNNN
jgi:hypothetical protein